MAISVYSEANLLFADYLCFRYPNGFKLTFFNGQLNEYRPKAQAGWKTFDLLAIIGAETNPLDFQKAFELFHKALKDNTLNMT